MPILHPYKDPAYIFNLLCEAGLIEEHEAKRLLSLTHIPLSKGLDLVQWLKGLKIPIKGSEKEVLEESHILELISKDRGWRFVRLDPIKLDMEVVTKSLPAHFCKRRLIVPIARSQGVIEVAAYDPLQKDLLFDISKACQEKATFVVAPMEDIKRVIDEFFEFRTSIKRAEDLLGTPKVIDFANLEQFVKIAGTHDVSKEKHINAAVDHLLKYALEERASDIHMEPKRDYARIRLRIDGVLHTVHKIPKVVHEAIATRIKALSRLDVAEKRRPQDGRMKISWQDSEAEIRISTVPVAFGEKLVLRIQTPEILFSDLEDLGMGERDLREYKKFLIKKHGIILVTGPTGSGKSTTLYSTLRYLNDPGLNIVTIEDPIEMICEDFNQIAVQPAIGITFSSILRNILRQDPDIVMIGEIRDNETARYAIQAALTGHLVLSTLHTNDSIGAITRLQDLGIEPYLIASTLIGVVAQRLVRKICPFCRTKVRVEGRSLSILGLTPKEDNIFLWKGKGCSKCRHTGYLGRIGIYEVFDVSPKISELIHKGAGESSIRQEAERGGMTPLSFDAAQKVLSGITTIDEALSSHVKLGKVDYKF
ncbi:Type II secretory pathway, ATPase PulE/Tfp pilus assembly pathway, ATPase PilB [Dissulfuribacter thermophilus]|uniref:Type II secretory pathway, ATPase PulE/Tfp pilus assembly pathway, ATPase PilB n=1 Tax=Dissulfuribacter thermophilus TaxID=1156395 RepID=A0A1B9F783_9BACT|nr:GspE/PulE family protein [Dissulfuribacter thermophilus]OCC15818.1 Type II secretory pathway, ATPase PulE/Tfp pilus assembly pathway, ATPase PilB [Dissulfuribacter thermophilus]